MKPDLIQIAGVIDQSEATLLVDSGADYLGFPLGLDVHAEDIPEGSAAAIIHALPPRVRAVLITYLGEAEAVVGLCRRLGCTAVQLHGDMRTSELVRLRAEAPDIEVIKSLIVRGSDSLAHLRESMMRCSAHVDAFITDTFDPWSGASGATGKTHDWTVSRRLAKLSDKPVILAGGLKPENVGAAIRFVRPAGVDVHTGVENVSGRKDPRRVRDFVAEARAAFLQCRPARISPERHL